MEKSFSFQERKFDLASVGVMSFSTLSGGIGGSIKRRYSDFVVEEIQKDGRVCEAKRFVEDTEHFSEDGAVLKVPDNPDGKEHLLLDLEKINRDTNFAVRNICRFLQCSKKRIGYAGLKDKRAITCQRISVFSPNVERISSFSLRGLELRNAEWGDERIVLGSHLGNRFTVVVRNVSLEEKEIRKRIGACFEEIEGNGVANFFGEQRFGGLRAITHLVGKEIVKRDFEKAVMIYLTSTFEGEKEDVQGARKELWETRDFKRAIRQFPREYVFERAIIGHLCSYPMDFVGCFRVLPKQMAYLFTHALQSFLFNRVLSERISTIGLHGTDGDILIDSIPTAPLFGFDSVFAKGNVGDLERRVLEEEGLNLDDFRIKEFPELSSKGTRRQIVVFPKNLELLELGKDAFFEGKSFVKIMFDLDKGSYATIVLREIMKN